MARRYDFTFRSPDGAEAIVRGSGNTRRSAERSARRALRRETGADPSRFVTVEVEFIRPHPTTGTGEA